MSAVKEKHAARDSEDPTPVVIAAVDEPVPVVMAKGSASLGTVTKGEGTTLSPTTTEAQDKVTEGQRYVNRLWEHTQAIIAIGVTFTTCFVLAFLTVMSVMEEVELSANALLLVGYLVVMATSIITSYFTRTNHDKTGGVGPKPTTHYEGR